MASVNTLIRKGYLLAGVIMAANMFIVNEVKATDDNDNKTLNMDENDKKLPIINVLLNSSGFILLWENTINLATGFVFSSVNNYFRWWDYNAGSYRKLGCFGWRSGRFLKDYLQFEINLNVVRGILWLIPGAYFVIKYFKEEKEDYVIPLYFSFLVADSVDNFFNNYYSFITALIISFLIQGFVSMPLAIHISNFSIAISLDSIFWASVGKFLSPSKKENEENGYIELNSKDEDNEDNIKE
jgi:hypothetical protein